VWLPPDAGLAGFGFPASRAERPGARRIRHRARSAAEADRPDPSEARLADVPTQRVAE